MARMQMIPVALIFSLFVFLPIISARSAQFHSCDGNSEVKVTGLEITPYPAQSGKPATFAVAASTDKPISGGKLLIEISLFGVHIRTETHDICEETNCPISPGKFEISHSQELPGITPPGLYNLKMRMKDEKNKQLACIRFQLSIRWGAVADA